MNKTKRVDTVVLPDGFVDTIIGLLKDGSAVRIRGIGTLRVVKIPARTLYHNFAKKQITIGEYHRVKLVHSKKLKDALAFIFIV